MLMYDNGKYGNRLQELKSEEMLLEKKLTEDSNTLKNHEVEEINNRLTGIRFEKEVIEQLLSGAFF